MLKKLPSRLVYYSKSYEHQQFKMSNCFNCSMLEVFPAKYLSRLNYFQKSYSHQIIAIFSNFLKIAFSIVKIIFRSYISNQIHSFF